MKNIVKFFVFWLFCFLLTVLIHLLLPDSFSQSYQRGIVRQYKALKNIEGNKIVFVGASTLAFGFDLGLMEKLTGKKCAILACHAGLGLSNMIELSKCNLISGDIVVLEYTNTSPNDFGAELLLTAIGRETEMFQYIDKQKYVQLLRAYPSYILKNILYSFIGGYKSSGGYYLSLFDEVGAMACERKSIYQNVEQVSNDPSFPKLEFIHKQNSDWIDFVNEFYEYTRRNNIKLFITKPCYCSSFVVSSDSEIEKYDEHLSKLLKAPIISRSKDYLFSFDMFFNTSTHCNSIGARKRTNKLANDLKKFIHSL